jgi:hypothetical protein
MTSAVNCPKENEGIGSGITSVDVSIGGSMDY